MDGWGLRKKVNQLAAHWPIQYAVRADVVKIRAAVRSSSTSILLYVVGVVAVQISCFTPVLCRKFLFFFFFLEGQILYIYYYNYLIPKSAVPPMQNES